MHKIEPPYATDMNLLEYPHQAKLCEDPKKRDLEVLQCKDNIFPRGLAPLEELFDFNNVARNPKMESTKTDIDECNIGSEEEPKMIKLSKTLPALVKQK